MTTQVSITETLVIMTRFMRYVTDKKDHDRITIKMMTTHHEERPLVAPRGT